MHSSQRPMAAQQMGLEAPLQHLLHHHNHASLVFRHHTEKAKKDAIRRAASVSDLLVEAVNGRVQQSFINENRIEYEIRALAATVTGFMKQTDQWLTSTHALNIACKMLSANTVFLAAEGDLIDV